MYKPVLFIVVFLGIVSCYNDKQFYSLAFDDIPVKNVSEKLIKFSKLLHKMKPVYYHYDEAGDMVIGVDNATDSSRNIKYDANLVINYTRIGTWDSVKHDTTFLYNISEISNFTRDEKEEFWSIFIFLVNNEINGSYFSTNLTSFPFRQHPFADRHFMYIIFEEEFNRLSDYKKKVLLQNQLIIDRSAGLLLIIGNKSRFLRYIYGSDADVPEEWKKPTETVFRVHAH